MKVLLIFLTGCITTAFAQMFVTNPNKWMEYVEELAVETENAEQVEALYEELSYLAEHPMDVNRVTAEELRRLPFLSDRQIEGILAFRKRSGNIISPYLLMSVDGITFQTIELLLPFVYTGDQAARSLSSHGRHQLRIRYDPNFQKKDLGNYLGEPFYHSLHYTYSLDKRLYAGVSAEKDVGEPFRRGYDFYSGYVFLSDIRKYLSTFVIGDYKASFGRGLVIHNGFNVFRNNLTAQGGRSPNGFRRHASTNESDYLRGVAATAVWGLMEYSLFYSSRQVDATLTSDSTFSAFKTDGLHRLPRDYEKRHTVRLQTFGGNASYSGDRFGVGFTAVAHTTGKLSLQPDEHPYNLFFLRGNHNANASLDYYLQLGNARFYGETALSLHAALATLHAVHFVPVPFLDLLLLYRNYSPRYQALYASAFSQSSDIRNENGLYTSFIFSPFSHWTISAYLDLFRHPWLRYGVGAPSSGKEYMTQVDYKPASNFSTSLLYKCRRREKDQELPYEPYPVVAPYTSHRLRLQFHYGNGLPFSFRTAVDAVRYLDALPRPSHGFAFSQTLAWHPAKPVHVDLYAALFHTDDYNSRLFSYEKQLLYNFQVNSLYGHNLRLSALLRWDITAHLSAYAHLTHTDYTDLRLLLCFNL
jgi:hypothetical protein